MLWWITSSTNNNALIHSQNNKCQLEKCHCCVDADLFTRQTAPVLSSQMHQCKLTPDPKWLNQILLGLLNASAQVLVPRPQFTMTCSHTLWYIVSFFFSLQLRRLDASLLFVQSFFSVLCFWMRHQQSRHVQAGAKSLATYQIQVGCWSDDKKNRMLFNKWSSYRKDCTHSQI